MLHFLLLLACSPSAQTYPLGLTLDAEVRVDGTPLTSGTQSLNRYHSVLRGLDQVQLTVGDTLDLSLSNDAGARLTVQGVDPRFLTPLLPYPHAAQTDAFDQANLFLAEYARSGVSLPYQSSNTRFGGFYASDGLLPEGEEYRMEGAAVVPNPQVRPRRLSVTNNCLQTGLWEINASDSVGEMFHGWLDVPEAVTLGLMRRVNGLRDSDDTLRSALAYRSDLGPVPLYLDRLRTSGQLLAEGPTVLAPSKRLGGYSTQDSRRKVQRGFFRVQRDADPDFAPQTFAELAAGDRFSLYAFVPPGVYDPASHEVIPFDPGWNRFRLRRVQPLTAFPGQQPTEGPRGALELTLLHDNGTRGLVLGNLPIDLLVFQEDFGLPAFGAGVHLASELIERRMLRYAEGPRPSFAYLFDPSTGHLVNNHAEGLEQVFLRPFERDGEVWLRVTLVSYERIVDLLELELKLPEDLAAQVRIASAEYTPPLYRVYRDDNVL